MGKIKDTDLLLINRDGVDYNSPVEELSIPKKTSELDNDANFITLSEVPEPDLEGSLVFRGTVANEGALPGDAVVGDLYYNEDDQHLYAKGESEWHKVGQIDDVDLSEYARLDGAEFTDTVTIKDPNNAFTRVELSTTSIGSNQQNQGFSLMKAHELALISLFDSEIFISPFVLNDGDPDHGESVIRAKKAKATLHSITLDNNNRDIPDFIEGAEFRPGYLSLVHRSGSSGFEVDGATTSVNAPDFTVTAKEFIGDGSKLTNLPGGGAVPINEVLAEGNIADPYQHLNFKLESGDIPEIPYTKESIEIDGGSGLRLGGLASYMVINEPFSINTESGEVTEFQTASRRMTAADDYYYSTNERGDWWCGVGLTGISYRNAGSYFKINGSEMQISWEDPKDKEKHQFKLFADTWSDKAELFCNTITADEFIGDGSKLTNLPVGDVDLDGYAKLDGSTPFTGQIQTAEAGIKFETTGYESELSITSYKAKGLCTEIVWGDKDGGEYGHVKTPHFEGHDIRLKIDDADSTDTVLEVLTWGDVKATIDAQGSITAKEFIGDGSKLTNLPTGGDVDLDGYATEDWVEAKGYITADDLPEAATVADLPDLPD